MNGMITDIERFALTVCQRTQHKIKQEQHKLRNS